MATMMEMINIVDINSVIAKMKLLNIPLMEEAKLPVATKANYADEGSITTFYHKPDYQCNKNNINPMECR
jgi:hypothetical protein